MLLLAARKNISLDFERHLMLQIEIQIDKSQAESEKRNKPGENKFKIVPNNDASE